MRRRKIVSDDDLVGDLKGRNLVEPSRRILAEAIALGGRLAPARKGLVAWIAELLFDSGLAPATAGVRSGAAACCGEVIGTPAVPCAPASARRRGRSSFRLSRGS